MSESERGTSKVCKERVEGELRLKEVVVVSWRGSLLSG